MRDKKRWEKWYENFKSPNVQARLEELKTKVENKTISKDEYVEYQNMQKIMSNIPKVDNIIDFIDKLETELETLKDEYNKRESKLHEIGIDGLEKEIELNLKQQEELLEKRKTINKKIEQTDDKEEIAKLEAEKEDIDQDLSKLKFQANENNKKFAEVKSKEAKNVNNKNELSKYSNEELRTRCFKVSSMISKCNMVATNLMKGLSIDSIKVKLEGWKDKKFTSKEPLPLSRAEKIKQQERKNEKEEDIEEQIQNRFAIISGNTKGVQTSALPIKQNEFEKAFPRLAKRFPNMKDNFLGKALLKAKNFFKPDKQEEKEEEEENSQKTTVLPKQEEQLSEENKKQNKLFRDYLKYDVLEVAEKGVEQVRKERIEQKRDEFNKTKEAKDNEEER